MKRSREEMKRSREEMETQRQRVVANDVSPDIASHVLSIKVVVETIASFLSLQEMAPLAQTCHSIRNAFLAACIEYRHTCHLKATPFFVHDEFLRGLLTSGNPKCLRLVWRLLGGGHLGGGFPLAFDHCLIASHSSSETIVDTFQYCNVVPGVNRKTFNKAFKGYLSSPKFNLEGVEKLLSRNHWEESLFDILYDNSDIVKLINLSYCLQPNYAIIIHSYFEKYVIPKRYIDEILYLLFITMMYNDDKDEYHNGSQYLGHVARRMSPQRVLSAFVNVCQTRGHGDIFPDDVELDTDEDPRETLIYILNALMDEFPYGRWISSFRTLRDYAYSIK